MSWFLNHRFKFVNLYKIYVRPHLEFCTSAWSPWTESDLNTLEQVQKRAIRMISGLHSESYEEKLKELDLLSLKERRERADMIQTFKILQGFSDVNPSTWFSRIQISRTNVRSNFYSVRVPRKGNSIPSVIKESATVSIFKRRYD